mmetsp:Transcript_16271/g.30795  ORF Transcript_16271/g.30795 Transcript_16271/m.30795 type:complete len:131 (-) Transcript_16271:2053-2445(-)
MKLSAAIIIIISATAINAFSPISSRSQSRKSPVEPLYYGWDEYQKAVSGGAAPAPAPQQPPSYAAPPAPAAAPPVAPQQPDDDVPMSKAWASKVDYDPSKDTFPTFPPGYRTFDEIWAEFKAKKAAGLIK